MSCCLKSSNSLTRGDIDRLMVLMPPGSAKSTYTSVLFPAWWFVAHPKGSVIAASHTADLATHFGRHVRTVITENERALDYCISRESRSAGRWRTDKGGEYFATGVRGPLAGRRADLIIVDDPVKSYAEADSRYHRDRVWDWYRADLTTRLKPRGRLALIMTRWHEDDLAGRLLSHQSEKWRLVTLTCICRRARHAWAETGRAAVAGVGRCGGIGRSSADSWHKSSVSPLSTTTTAEAGCIFQSVLYRGRATRCRNPGRR